MKHNFLISKTNMHKKGHNLLFPVHQWLIFNIRFITVAQYIPHHKPLNRTEHFLARQEDRLPHKSPRRAGHSLCLQQSCRYQCFYITWHASQLAPCCGTLTHRDFRSSVMLFEPRESSDVLRRDALCLKYVSNLTLPYSWNRKLGCGIYFTFRASTFPLQMLNRYVGLQLLIHD